MRRYLYIATLLLQCYAQQYATPFILLPLFYIVCYTLTKTIWVFWLNVTNNTQPSSYYSLLLQCYAQQLQLHTTSVSYCLLYFNENYTTFLVKSNQQYKING